MIIYTYEEAERERSPVRVFTEAQKAALAALEYLSDDDPPTIDPNRLAEVTAELERMPVGELWEEAHYESPPEGSFAGDQFWIEIWKIETEGEPGGSSAG